MTMSGVAHWFSFIGGVVTLPLLVIGGVILHQRLRLASTLTLAVGLAVAAAGEFVQLFSPFAKKWSFQEIQGMVYGGFPAVWYLGSVITSVGLLLTCVGFGWFSVTVRKRVEQ